jgi:Fur family ferric uptake transcriptional regulator
MRQTKTHKQILSLLSKSPTPLSVADLLSHLTVNKTTIYRQLESLVKSKLVQEVRFSDRKIRYELTSLPHHHHLICTVCDSVQDILFSENIESLAQLSASDKQFSITNHYLEFFGLCAKCQSHV